MERVAALAMASIFNLPVVIIGIVLCCGKGAGMIAGYNTSTKAEKAQWNKKALCRGTGVLVLVIGACMELTMIGAIWTNMYLVLGSILLILFVTGAGIFYINTSKRFKR